MRICGPDARLNKEDLTAPSLSDDVTVSCPAMDRLYTQHLLNGLPFPSRGGKNSDALQLEQPQRLGRHRGQRSMRLVVRSAQSRFKRGQTQFVGSCLPASPGGPRDGKRPERKVLAVPVIAEIEDARKAGAGVTNFFPGPISPLMTKQIIDAPNHADGIGHAG